MDIPAPLTYGTITGHFISVVGDSTDVGAAPDVVTLSGTVSITPNVSQFRIIGPPVQLAVATTVTGTIIDGELLTADGTPLTVLASDTPGIDPSPIQYTAQFNLTGVKQQPKPVTFEVPGNGTIDIGSIVALPTAPPVQTIVSETSRIAAEAAATRAESAAASIVAQPPAFDMYPTTITDCNAAPDGYSIAQDGAANRPAGAQSASLILLSLHYAGFGTPYIFQTATREDTAQVFGRFMYGGTWYPWQTDYKFDTSGGLNMNSAFIYGLHDPIGDQDAATKKYVDTAVGPGPFSSVPAIANWDTAPDGVRLLDGSMQGMVNPPLPGVQMDGFITTVTYGIPGQTVAEWRFQTAMGLPWDGSPVRYLARSKFGGVWSAWVEVGGGTKTVALTQADYDALATKDPNTLYLITG